MKSKIISLILVAVSIIGLSVSPVAVSAIDDVCSSEAIDAVKDAAGCNGNADSANSLIISIINWVMGIIAMVAVVAIIIGGVQYMTSTGDAGKVKKAKDTILYAVIGLIVVALSAVIVNFVIANLVNPQSSSGPESTTTQPPTRPTRDEPLLD